MTDQVLSSDKREDIPVARSPYPSVPKALGRHVCRVSFSQNLVGVLGFEPRFSSLRGWASIPLNYTPNLVLNSMSRLVSAWKVDQSQTPEEPVAFFIKLECGCIYHVDLDMLTGDDYACPKCEEYRYQQ